ncbi:protein of unknown function [Chitinophaga costaii]|uniref:Zinc-dependent metalloprotease n=1 Tax=Chitinophaga costaii TaxID=1335309 RepID=A0A1C4E8J8_9BACT|nr:zinc-dependent metalloprotease [Chitinophaga costaii]PUZ24250.1 DUF5117 domain-containing protein [Chitinophaga costaii]SCC39875.1 protein of unknown function [Chitinophaga costaii]
MRSGFSIILLLLFGITLQAKELPTVSQFIKPGAKAYKGMFNIYLQDEQYFMQLPLALLNRDILTTITINKGSAQAVRDVQQRFGFAGDAVYDGVIRFSQGANQKVLLTQPVFYNAADSSSSYYKLLQSATLPVYMAFDIQAADSGSVLIDITTAFTGDNPMFSLKGVKEELKLGSYMRERSYPLSVTCYQDNIIFRSVKTYGPGGSAPQDEENRPANDEKKPTSAPTVWEVGACWYLLPDVPMQQRLADKRVGYFMRQMKDYSRDPNQVKNTVVATRWRLEPKPEDVARYERGELVEPAKPIVFYIDRNTPEALRPYFIAGVNAWQKAFEQIGFKNAILGKMEPSQQEDSAYAIDNVHYSIISYKPSANPNAYGPSIVDPRSGEILSSHVAVFHNVFDLVQRWYFVMCGVLDPRTHHIPFTPDVMGPLAQTVVCHEVGHTLGLRHNFAGSSAYDIDSIRNQDFLQKNSFGASMMDYMRFDYVVQPQDHIPAELLLPRVGVYDNYAIAWGYKYMPQFKTSLEESKYLRSWVSEKLKDPRLFYLQEGDFFDPRVQAEDVGNNAMKAGELGINNLKLLLKNIAAWTEKDDDDNYTLLRQMYASSVSRYGDYLTHVIKNLAGRWANESLRTDNQPHYVAVTKAQQQQAMQFLKTYFFEEPTWLFPKDICNKTGFGFNDQVAADYDTYLGKILYKCLYIAGQEHLHDNQDPYTTAAFFNDLYEGVFSHVEDATPISAYKRLLQQSYVSKLINGAINPAYQADNIAVLMKMQLDKIAATTKAAADKNPDHLSKMHLRAIADMIALWENGNPDNKLNK